MAADAPDSSPANSAPPSGDELKSLREMLEQQSRQLDVLAQEIARLNLLLEGKAGSAAEPAVPAHPAAGAGPAHQAEPPKAAPVAAPAATPTGPVHTVTKGETLTSIAHHYKVTVGDILKVNKIGDVRRLQIGQTVNLPPGAVAPQDSPSPQSTPTPQPH